MLSFVTKSISDEVKIVTIFKDIVGEETGWFLNDKRSRLYVLEGRDWCMDIQDKTLSMDIAKGDVTQLMAMDKYRFRGGSNDLVIKISSQHTDPINIRRYK